MFIPLGDEPNAKDTPWATYGLIFINVAFWLLWCRPATFVGVDPTDPQVLDYLTTMRLETHLSVRQLLREVTAYDVLTYTYGFRPAAPSIVALFASLFMHAGWMHLLGNMLFLYIFGDNVEARLGPRRYLALYLSAGVVATLFYALFRWGSPLPLIGASGAISGILGAYFIWFPRNRVRVLMTLVIFIQIIHVPARVVLLFYLVIENLLPFLFDSPGAGSTAYGAHVGGFFAGALVALAYDHWAATGELGSLSAWVRLARSGQGPRAWAWTASAASGAAAGAQQSEPAAVAAAIAAQNPELAWRLYEALSSGSRVQLAAQTCFDLADALTLAQNLAPAATVLQRYLSDHSAGPRPLVARAHLRLGLLQLRALGRPAAAREHLLSVLDLLPGSDEAQVAQQALLAC